ncbi:hypothetical protein ABZU45_22185 [Streptomyces avermitilis]
MACRAGPARRLRARPARARYGPDAHIHQPTVEELRELTHDERH